MSLPSSSSKSTSSSVKEYGNEIGGLLRSAGKEPASSQLGEQVDSPYFNEKMETMEKSIKISEGNKKINYHKTFFDLE